MSRVKNITAKEVQGILRTYFSRPKDSYAIEFQAEVEHGLPTNHLVAGTLILDHDEENLNQLSYTVLNRDKFKSFCIEFYEGGKRVNVYKPVIGIPRLGEKVKIVGKQGLGVYNVIEVITDYSCNKIICSLKKWP